MSTPEEHPTDALLDLVYDELPAREAARVREHLESCAACAATMQGMLTVRRAAAALPSEVAGAPGLESLLEAAERAASRVRRRRVSRWVGPIFAAVAIPALLLLVLRPQTERGAPLAEESGRVSSVGALAQNDAPAPPTSASELRAAPSVKDPLLARREKSVALAPAPALGAGARAAPLAKAVEPQAFAGAPPATGNALLGREGAAKGSAKRTAAVPEVASAPSAPAAQADAMRPAAVALAENRKTASSSTSVQAADAQLATRHADEARRDALLARLPQLTAADALPVLSELCTLEVRLVEEPSACVRVTKDYPGTAEARGAQAQLDAVHAR